jgi:hypothetical protein
MHDKDKDTFFFIAILDGFFFCIYGRNNKINSKEKANSRFLHASYTK